MSMRDNRNLEGTMCKFIYDGYNVDLEKYDNMHCDVLYRDTPDGYDEDRFGTVWVIEMCDGRIAGAFGSQLVEAKNW